MISMLLWSEAQISYQLNGLGILECYVLRFAYLLFEPLVDDLTKKPPSLSIIHHKQMIPSCDQVVGHVGEGPIAIDGAFSI